jgi:hypothetical protein
MLIIVNHFITTNQIDDFDKNFASSGMMVMRYFDLLEWVH